jgi:hypothetical protein
VAATADRTISVRVSEGTFANATAPKSYAAAKRSPPQLATSRPLPLRSCAPGTHRETSRRSNVASNSLRDDGNLVAFGLTGAVAMASI